MEGLEAEEKEDGIMGIEDGRRQGRRGLDEGRSGERN